MFFCVSNLTYFLVRVMNRTPQNLGGDTLKYYKIDKWKHYENPSQPRYIVTPLIDGMPNIFFIPSSNTYGVTWDSLGTVTVEEAEEFCEKLVIAIVCAKKVTQLKKDVEGTISKETLESLRQTYPAGTRVLLRKMNDPYAPPFGTLGTTVHEPDENGSILVKWDNGPTLNVNYDGENLIARIDEKEDSLASFEEDDDTRESIYLSYEP